MNKAAKRRITIEQANAMLPLVRAIAGDISRLAAELSERRQRLEHLTSGRHLQTRDPYEGELAHVMGELEKESARLRGFCKEIEALGLKVGDPALGAIDFPAEVDGRSAYYCWRVGEAEVNFWHSANRSCLDRQALAVDSASGHGRA